MSQAAGEAVATEDPQRGSRASRLPPDESHNLIVLAAHHVSLRIAWIFKTESVIMPAFLDVISGAGWIRGCLPVLNRFGQSVPPLLLSEPLRRRPRKKAFLVGATSGMAAVFLSLAALWWLLDRQSPSWLPAVFLCFYALFFICNGISQLAFATLQGKLIRVDRRGRLLSVSSLLGSVLAIGSAWWFLADWLALPGGGFELVFAFTGIGFAVACAWGMALREPPDAASRVEHRPIRTVLLRSARLLRDDLAFRRVAIVAMLFMCGQLLFPHYQAYAREELGTQSRDLMVWVVAQNAGAGIFGLLVGPLADRHGNRLAIRLASFFSAAVPWLAIALGGAGLANGGDLFWTVFALLGWMPLTMRTLSNYVLEISSPEDHPFYISSLRLCFAVPFVLSPLVGVLVDLIGFQVVFGAVGLAILAAAIGTFRMVEPRKDGSGVAA